MPFSPHFVFHIDISLFIEVWCNGSTTDFGSVSPSSNLGTSTIKATIALINSD